MPRTGTYSSTQPSYGQGLGCQAVPRRPCSERPTALPYRGARHLLGHVQVAAAAAAVRAGWVESRGQSCVHIAPEVLHAAVRIVLVRTLPLYLKIMLGVFR